MELIILYYFISGQLWSFLYESLGGFSPVKVTPSYVLWLFKSPFNHHFSLSLMAPFFRLWIWGCISQSTFLGLLKVHLHEGRRSELQNIYIHLQKSCIHIAKKLQLTGENVYSCRKFCNFSALWLQLFRHLKAFIFCNSRANFLQSDLQLV